MKTALTLGSLLFGGVLLLYVAGGQIRSNDATAAWQEAQELRLQQKHRAALTAMTRAVRYAPQNAWYHAATGLLYERQTESTSGWLVYLTRHESEGLALSERDRENIAAAARHYGNALALSPDDGFLRHNLGWLTALLGERQKALRLLQQAALAQPCDPLYYVSLGLWQERQRETTAALDSYAAALQLSPRLIESEFFRSLRERNPDLARWVRHTAIDNLTAKLRDHGDPISQARLGALYLSESPQLARRLLEAALAELPNLSRACFNLGRYYEATGNPATAGGYFRRAAFLERNDPFILLALGRICESEGKRREAMRNYALAIDLPLGHSLHAGYVPVFYHGVRPVTNDDLIPAGLAEYCSPRIERAAIYAKLVDLAEREGNQPAAQKYAALLQQTTSANMPERSEHR